jgi:hypothetical protein
MDIELPPEEIAPFFERDFIRIEKELLEEIKKSCEERTPVASGRLKNSWKIEGNSVINDVPYAGIVEEGSSSHRPVGMVATTLLDVDNMLEEINNH